MLQRNLRFLKPSTEHRTLGILQALSEDSTISQWKLGRRAGLSSARINGYLKEMKGRGFLAVNPLNAKSFEYQVTDEGEQKRRELLGEYFAEVVRSYTALKEMVRKRLSELTDRGIENIVLYGAAETGEVVLQAIEPLPLRVIAVVDSDPAKQGRLFGSYVVLPPSVLLDINCQAVVISSFGKSDEIYKSLENNIDSNKIPVVRL